MEREARDGGPDVYREDPGRMRVSDEERHRVAEVLRQAAGEGRLDLDELDERLQAAYDAKTYGDLVPLTADLPVAGAPPAPAPAPRPRVPAPTGSAVPHAGSIAIMSETRRTGRWLVQDGHAAFALMGSVVLDLREAEFGSGEVTINANAVMGEVKVLVDAGTSVVVDGFGVMGEYTEQRPKVPFDRDRPGPRVRVRGVAFMGSVHVQRRGAPGEARRRLGGFLR